MAKPHIPVVNPFGDHEETIERIAKKIGQSKVRKDILQIIYGRGSKPKTVSMILEKCEDRYPRQSIVNAVNYLEKNGLIQKISIDEDKPKKKVNGYAKVDFVNANKNEILSYVNNQKKLKNIPT